MEQQAEFPKKLLERAKSRHKHIVLPEGNDRRILDAAMIIARQHIAELTILGDIQQISSSLQKADLSAINIIDPSQSDKIDKYAQFYYSLRKHKGITFSQAVQQVTDPIFFGTMMLKCDEADGLVAGAAHSTAATVRPALQIIKGADGIKTISSLFFMCLGKNTYIFADCGIVEDPTVDQLAEIAFVTAETALQFDFKPRIAMLSYSTKGSASGAGAEKVITATRIAKQKITQHFGDKVLIDGELQFDSAFVPEIASRKCPDSPVAGAANVFIFPDLDAGNITYKAVQRMAGYRAFGPILQGLNKPMNDLSRGCNAEDIVATIAVTAVQAQR
ncbi:MAG: phosphate acetyltransferase [Planctomycetota bacterium]